MNAPHDWTATAAEFERVKAEMLHSQRARRIARISHRLTKPECFKCGGEEFWHRADCSRRSTGLNARVRFDFAVIAAAKKLEFKRSQNELMASLKVALAPEKYARAFCWACGDTHAAADVCIPRTE